MDEEEREERDEVENLFESGGNGDNSEADETPLAVPPVVLPQPVAMPEPVSPPESEPIESKWQWVGAQESRTPDGISDLFEVDSEPDTDDLISVDIEQDVIDGPLDDLLDVTEEDIMGDELGQQDLNYRPQPRPRPKSRYRITRRPQPPETSIGGLGY